MLKSNASESQTFNYKTTGCEGKVTFIDRVVPAIVELSQELKKPKKVDVKLTCNNPGVQHTNIYEAIIINTD